ncbi:MAG: hypothetical protein ACO3ND_01345 [Opitutales bacterium]
MSILRNLAALAAGLTIVAGLHAQRADEVTRRARLRIAWWGGSPDNPPELALQLFKDRLPVSPNVMSVSQVIQYSGPAVATVVRKTVGAELDKSGNPVEVWLPFCSVPIPADDMDLAVILFANPQGTSAQPKVFDFSTTVFPYGTIKFVNYTKSRVHMLIGNRQFTSEGGTESNFPERFTGPRSQPRYVVAVEEPGSPAAPITDGRILCKPNSRSIFFILQVPGETLSDKYRITSITEYDPPKLRPPDLPPTGTPPPPADEKNGRAKKKAG